MIFTADLPEGVGGRVKPGHGELNVW